MEERIKARIEALVKAREAFVIEHERQLLGFDAAIGELQALLAPDVLQSTADVPRQSPAERV